MTGLLRNRVFGPSVALWGAVLLIGGCDAARTDTGYEPHRLSMNGTQIRALYAPAFSPEAEASKDEQKDTMHNVHPGPGGF